MKKTIEDIIYLFKKKFVSLYKEIVTDVIAKQEYYMNWYLESVLSDTAGLTGLEIIRRVVGDSKVLDITSIKDINARVKAERMLILTAKSFIKNRNTIKRGSNYVEIFNNNI